MNKKTKIIATIGPSSWEVEQLVKLSQAGMDIARINFSHGDSKSLDFIMNNIKIAEKKSGRKIAILQDLAGPKIRTGDFKNGEIILKKNSKVKIFSKKILGNNEEFSISYKNLFKDIKKGERILINDGKQELKIISKTEKFLITKVIVGGMMRSRRGVNLPDSNLTISVLTKKDKEDLVFAEKYNPDFIALSFVKDTKSIQELKNILIKKKITSWIISKIETTDSVKNIDDIIKYSDAIMVARGDLAVEIGAQKVPMIQKMIIKKCNDYSKPVIVATQMLESMIESPVPTRAEVSDIANAIEDGADTIMLSEETALGKFSVKTVQTMTAIAVETEKHLNYEFYLNREVGYQDQKVSTTLAICRHAVKTAYDLDAKVIVALTESGSTTRMVSRFKPRQNILTISPSEDTLYKTKLIFGSLQGGQEDFEKVNEAIEWSKKLILKKKLAKKGDKIVIVAGIPSGKSGGTNSIFVENI